MNAYVLFALHKRSGEMHHGWTYQAPDDSAAIRSRPIEVNMRITDGRRPPERASFDISHLPYEIWRVHPDESMTLVHEGGPP